MAWTNSAKSTATWTNTSLPDIDYLWGADYYPWLATSYPWKKMNTYSEWTINNKISSSWTNSSKS